MKKAKLLMSDETLFKDEEVFTPSYVPEDFIHRDDQLGGLSLALKPGLRGVSPLNTLLHGPPGTGKTTAIKYLFNQVAEETSRLLPVYINCEDCHTRFSIFSKIHEKVFGHSPPDTGKPLESVKERVFRKLTSEKKTLAVALDEFDNLFLEKNVDSVLLDLLKAHSSYGFDKVGIIGIMIDEKYMSQLDVKTKSVYNPQEIFFQPYTVSEIREILLNRAKFGFYPGVVSENVLDIVVEKTFSQGDLRVGIDLLRRSAYLAESKASKKVTKEHVEEAFEKGSRLLGLKKVVGALDAEEGELLRLIASSDIKSSGEIYEAFNRDTRIGIKKYNQIIQKLEHYKLIDTSYKTGERGRNRDILLRYDSADLLKALK
ncbi:MAG: ORC1-type DNA replication protein [Candidatus Altiarchaeota archaeon]